MKYTVVWLASVEGSLIRLWLDSRLRLAVTEAADRIDLLLKRDPLGVGESRHGDLRILFEKPLGVHYRVAEADRTVKITDVWRY